jgi:(p)ppGpp synthetase, RelA/SpoT family
MVTVTTREVSIREAHASDLEGRIARLVAGRSATEIESIRRAAHLAEEAHRGQLRASDQPYVEHVFATAEILADLHLDHETLAAALLHDVVEDTELTLLRIEEEVGPAIAHLVDGITKLDVISAYRGRVESERREQVQAESLRKMLLAMAEDVRVVLIKLADRLDNMRTLEFLAEEKRTRIAQETLDIYAPLANHLGIWQIKWELEDLSLRYLDGEAYRRIASLLDERRIDREQYIKEVVSELRSELQAAEIEAQVAGRPKHIYSIWRKMKHKGLDFHELFDVRGVRVLVQDMPACYAALGVVHTLWRHIPGEFDDYITAPKGNSYQSLHTAVIGPKGRTLEVQIRTHEMHQQAELGVAAHWRYKEGGRRDPALERKIAWLRQILEWKEDVDDASDFIDRFKAEAFHDRVYVLTPAGDVIDLPQEATPLDFAYHIHTDVGHRCRGAKVDGVMVPLSYELRSGQQVEILTTRHASPSRDWLNLNLGYLKSNRARAKVRYWFRQQDYEKNLAAGRSFLERALQRLGLSDMALDLLAARLHFSKPEALLGAIGRGDITSAQIAGAIQAQQAPLEAPPPLLPQRSLFPQSAPGDVTIHGVRSLLTHTALCCKPAPMDPIVGYITRGRGITIHRQDCANVLRLTQDRQRLIEVAWGSWTEKVYLVDIRVRAYDRQGLLRDITAILCNEKINVTAVHTKTDQKDSIADMRLTLEIANIGQLSRVLDKIARLANVLDARRQV